MVDCLENHFSHFCNKTLAVTLHTKSTFLYVCMLYVPYSVPISVLLSFELSEYIMLCFGTQCIFTILLPCYAMIFFITFMIFVVNCDGTIMCKSICRWVCILAIDGHPFVVVFVFSPLTDIHLSLCLYSRHWRTSICRWVCILAIDGHLNIYTTIRLPLSIGASWSWSHGSWVSNYLFNQCLSSLTLWVRIPLRRCVLDTTLCDKVYQWHAAGRWFSPSTPVSSFRHDIAEILLKVALNTINQT